MTSIHKFISFAWVQYGTLASALRDGDATDERPKLTSEKTGPLETSGVFYPTTSIDKALDREDPGEFQRLYQAAVDEVRTEGTAGYLASELKEMLASHEALVQDTRDGADCGRKRFSDDVHTRWLAAFNAIAPWAKAVVSKPKQNILPERPMPQHDEDAPPRNLLAELSCKSRSILEHLWKNPTSTVDELHGSVWARNPVEDATVVKAVERLAEKLLKLGRTDILIETKGIFISLKRPDKK